MRPVFREHPIPTADSKLYIVANGPDGAIWFCKSGPGQIGRLDPNSGVITEFSLPNPACAPIGIVTGADGPLWFTGSRGHKVGRQRRLSTNTGQTSKSTNEPHRVGWMR